MMDSIQTYTGREFFPLKPNPADVDIRDIAHALALKSRFGGHCRVFYSVAEHCVRVSRVLAPQHALWGLLHDAGEAYLADVPRPVKAQWPEFGKLEERVLAAVRAHFGLGEIPPEIWRADDVLLATEARDLMEGGGMDWRLTETALTERIVPITWEAAEAAFMARYQVLVSVAKAESI